MVARRRVQQEPRKLVDNQDHRTGIRNIAYDDRSHPRIMQKQRSGLAQNRRSVLVEKQTSGLAQNSRSDVIPVEIQTRGSVQNQTGGLRQNHTGTSVQKLQSRSSVRLGNFIVRSRRKIVSCIGLFYETFISGLTKPVSLIIRGAKFANQKVIGWRGEIDLESQIDQTFEDSQNSAFSKQIIYYEKQLEETTKKLAEQNKEIDHQRCEIAMHKEQVKQLKQQHQDELENLCAHNEDKIKKERIAREELSNRLSKALSTQLTDGNPNVADLSDMNRPTKLVEKFSELYDNEWTNAYGVLEENFDEYNSISALLKILLHCYQECRQYAAKQLDTAKGKTAEQQKVNISPSKYKHLKDEIKRTAYLTMPFVHELVEKSLENKLGKHFSSHENVQSYVQRCTELCWLMAVQDPPMAISDDVPNDLKYKNAFYRQYTKTGNFVKYVVWPAILIQDGGALMAKGIVQCCDNPQESELR